MICVKFEDTTPSIKEVMTDLQIRFFLRKNKPVGGRILHSPLKHEISIFLAITPGSDGIKQ